MRPERASRRDAVSSSSAYAASSTARSQARAHHPLGRAVLRRSAKAGWVVLALGPLMRGAG